MIIHNSRKVKGTGKKPWTCHAEEKRRYIAEIAGLEKRCYSTAKVPSRLLRENISLLSKGFLLCQVTRWRARKCFSRPRARLCLAKARLLLPLPLRQP